MIATEHASAADTHVTRHGVALDIRGAHDAEPIVLMHGIGGSARSSAELAVRLTRHGYRTICWDAPGYGRSLDPADEVLDHSVVLENVLDDLGIESAHLFGTSWGGVIAMRAALRNPARFRSLILADSTRGSGTSVEKSSAMLSRVTELEQFGAEHFAECRAERLLSPSHHPSVEAAVREDMATVRIPGYRAAAQFMASSNVGPDLHRISAPTLVLVGEHDVITGVAESRLLADAIPGARFGLILEAGHAALQEQPDAMAAHITTFHEGVQQ
ncbi:alpha/beta fold hydrolase [Rhodococcus sp. 105337]|uniref:alpha/beta fold hydrolase n=1 Tax=unclassified Rhodococcus (in: high G+C Gram-positive bacteria) TaxID=192944 RepID=UPI00146F51A7|nr:alpha/beta fold hydrolase [Rhodococcus sp. 105337]NME81065.1 alpha/beta fold hydrolase [Rhodococcus sp. 105337]